MEAHKERAEQEQAMKKKAEKESDEAGNKNNAGKPVTVKDLIRESIITTATGDEEDGVNRAQQPDDVLAFSRSVNRIDSSHQ
ncbi:hypothetical protein CUMW_027770 [Citrus unshiu]|nr:hypothetical protein CUMW_027770 [Citrus unshiu]